MIFCGFIAYHFAFKICPQSSTKCFWICSRMVFFNSAAWSFTLMKVDINYDLFFFISNQVGKSLHTNLTEVNFLSTKTDDDIGCLYTLAQKLIQWLNYNFCRFIAECMIYHTKEGRIEVGYPIIVTQNLT